MHENRCKNGDHQCNGNANNDTGCNRFFHPFRLLPSKASRRDDREPVSDAERKSGHHFIDRRAGTHGCNRRIAECMADNQCVHRIVNLLKYTGCHDRQGKKKQRFQNRSVKQINPGTPLSLWLWHKKFPPSKKLHYAHYNRREELPGKENLQLCKKI